MLVQEEIKQIGVVAKESGVPIKTIRYYEELGLLKASGRTEGGFRLFHSDVFARLSFIKRAQSLGLTLSEIKDFLNVHDQGDLPCEHIKVKLQDKLVDIDQQIRQLVILKQELEGLLSGWETIPETPEETICPIIEKIK
ncbi:transcriptional regulator [Scytonema sp. HK-05]|uniref:heavy metal-responsive transcriptional regulator n=1 Tax=Scytonema sp. HK-05 TaxID=1137095 RepID=UPI000937F86B|nr:heavy metal-responsive transcriptional regulator [Scytonema sp. HK-05]OKH52518.1 heavy metal-responsive transcriptional regulator [Scytonema sp. HK-05]BAY47374.1 transcriptional regulator [Scytonema sp. HK-05]